MSDHTIDHASPEVVEAAIERAHRLRSRALVDGIAALTGRSRDKDTRD